MRVLLGLNGPAASGACWIAEMVDGGACSRNSPPSKLPVTRTPLQARPLSSSRSSSSSSPTTTRRTRPLAETLTQPGPSLPGAAPMGPHPRQRRPPPPPRRRRVVLVTGCAEGGLGHALCRAFAAAGCDVFATARSLGAAGLGLQRHGCRELELDVTDEVAARRVVRQVAAEAGGNLDVLVNCAGAMLKAWAAECPLDALRRVVEVNFIAAAAMAQAAAPLLAASGGGGLVVNVGSAAGYAPAAQAAAYSASKAALRAYGDALRVELAPLGVRVMHVAPGFLRTGLFSKRGTIVPPPAGSMYSRFPHASRELEADNLREGIGALGATDPDAFARRVVALALRRRPPRHYVGGWLGWPLYLLGCYAPCWLLDALQLLRLRMWPACW